MRRFQAVPYQDQSEINLSPMLDVVFIMLIFFIVVASFIDEQGLPVLLPNS
ncbi:MAG: biopolymer transporter ExbD [Gammaproteobacteria bacterium]|nr:biopolymer transporter ExbD [Gammaproteobacteria bacterium]